MKNLLRAVCLIAVIIKSCQSFNLTLMHTNDFRARFEEFNEYLATCTEQESVNGKCFGGIPRMVTVSEDIRKSRENVLFLNAGNSFMGTIWYSYYRGVATAYFSSKLGINAAALGHHEFDDGLDGLSSFINSINYTMVSSNLNSDNEPRLEGLYSPATILNVGGEQIGVVGYIPQEITQLIRPDYIENLIFDDAIESIQREVNNLLDAGVNKIFAVGSGGLEFDQKLAREVDGIDVIIGGGSYSFLYSGAEPSNEVSEGPYPLVVEKGNNEIVLIVHAYGYGKYIGHLDLSFDGNGDVVWYGGNPLLLDHSVLQDVETLDEILEWKKSLNTFIQNTIGSSFVFLNGSRAECRGRECNFGNLLTDAVLASYLSGPVSPGLPWTDVAIAVWNGGAIRKSINQGDVSFSDVFEALPYQNKIVRFHVMGSTIMEMLEHTVAAYDPNDLSGAFLQMAGLKVEYNLWKPVGERVVRVQVRCADCLVPRYEILDEDRMYGMLTSEFLYYGGDGYTMLKENAVDYVLLGAPASSVVVDYFKNYSPIQHGVEQRISFSGIGVTHPPSQGLRIHSSVHVLAVLLMAISQLT